MNTNLGDFRKLIILSNEGKNIVLFPVSKTEHFIPNDPDGIECYGYFASNKPTELSYPYTREELAEKIENVIEQWCKYPCFAEEVDYKLTFEAKYYGEKSFKAAMKGKKMIHVGWDDIQGKYVTLMLPCKSGYAYLEIDERKLKPEADWIDFADAVIELIEEDLSKLSSFKSFKKKLNL